MQVVILAWGLGTRLRPITESIPKPMVEVNNRPFLEYQISMLQKHGFNDFVILVGYLWEQIESYFWDGSDRGVAIRYSYEKDDLKGTGGALKLAEDLLDDEFVLVFGDSFLEIDYQDLISRFHQNPLNKGMLVAYDNGLWDTDVKENLLIENRGILRYEKWTDNPELNYVDAGVMIFKKEILDLIPKDTIISLEEAIYPVLIEKGWLGGYVTQNRFFDIGTFDRLKVFDSILR